MHIGGDFIKKVFIILFESETEFLNASNDVSEKFTKVDSSKVFCGSWGEIQFNKTECLNSISSVVNNFILSTDKKEIYFGCSKNDVLEIESMLLTKECIVEKLSYEDFMSNFNF